MGLFRAARTGRTLVGGAVAILIGGAVLVQSLLQGNLQNALCGTLVLLGGIGAVLFAVHFLMRS